MDLPLNPSDAPVPSPDANADPATALTLDAIQERVQQALRQWHADPAGPSPLAPLHLFQRLRQSEVISEHEATNRVLYQGLQLLEERYPQDAMLLRQSELDNQLNDLVANALNVAPSTLYRHKRQALAHLAEVIWERETQLRQSYRTRMLARLEPPSYSHLWGIDAHIEQLCALLAHPGPPWIVTLAGIGGIGKTTLADAAVRGLLQRGVPREIGWVTARQTRLQWSGPLQSVAEPALTLEALAEELCVQLIDERIVAGPGTSRNLVAHLRATLKAQPHVVVVDNLETVTDIEPFIAALRDLAAPSKFLLTTRESLLTQPDIYHYAVPELAERDAHALIRREAAIRNFVPLLQATDEQLRPIVDVAGGNPLALRLIVGLAYTHALPVVLENLARARGTHIENLYTYVFHHSWQRLDEESRAVLLAMPLVTASGAEVDDLVEISELPKESVVRGLDLLVKLNLVDVRGDLYQRRYSIHNLTRSFLHEQVLRWQ